MRFEEPWEAVEEANTLHEELQREVPRGHSLFGLRARAIARRCDCDDVLFEIAIPDFTLAVVHLTWSAESAPPWPYTVLYRDWEHFRAECHDPDVREWRENSAR